MAKKVNNPPILGFDPKYMLTTLTSELISHATRLNLALVGDGTEPAPLPVILAAYTVSTLPDATKYTGGIIYVSNGTANKRLAVSDGTNWRFPDGNIVS